MTTLRVKFCGLCMWVPDNSAMTVLMPRVDTHVGHGVELHVIKLLVPKKPNAQQSSDFDEYDLDDRVLHLPATNATNTVASHGLPLAMMALIRDVAKRGPPRGYLRGTLQGMTGSRVTLHAGRHNGDVVAEGKFAYGGVTKPLAHIVGWEIAVPGPSITLAIRDRNDATDTTTLTVSEGLVEPGYIDVEVHCEPKTHLPGGSHVGTVPKKGLIAKHFIAFYDLIPGAAAAKLPVCEGQSLLNWWTSIWKSATSRSFRRGSDPVTCVNTFTDPD